MKNVKNYLIPIILVILLVPGEVVLYAQLKPVDYVNPFIGTAARQSSKKGWGNGNTYPGAVVPWGMVSVSPHTAPGSANGYIHGKPYLYGFGHVQLSGVGCSDLGNVVLMPATGKIETTPGTYKSKYADEKASPGYYKTILKPSDIIAEMTATTRTGMSKYTFPAGEGDANILLDASVTENSRMMPALGHVNIVSNTEVVGWTESGHFCGAPHQTQKVYFVAKLSKPADSAGTWIGNEVTPDKTQSGRSVGAYFRFHSNQSETIYIKVGISYVSIANARLNLKAEQPGWDFAAIRDQARSLWNHYLSRIEVEGGTKAEKTMFYTGLYHMLIHPSVFNDVNGDYLTMGHNGVAKARGYTHYDVYSLWDTYRDEHDFLTLFYPEREHDMVESMLAMYKESHWLPKWELAGGETYVMVGDPAVNVISETFFNGIHNFDTTLAYTAMKHESVDTVNNPIRPGLKEYMANHYIPVHTKGVWGGMSTTLEYNFADYALSRFAKAMGHNEDASKFLNRSTYYKNMWDPSSGFLRPKNKDGSWYTPFDPTTKKVNEPGFVEGNAWNYLFFVPHDPHGLANMMGGDNVFVKRLQESIDKGYFVMWNEPDMAYPYLFTYFKNEAWRTQKAVRETMKEDFTPNADGLPGNDDCGVTSAWYVFSALGFYPANPVSGKYRLGSPLFKKVVIHLNPKYYAGNLFIIKADNASGQNIYVKSVKLNGQTYKKTYITHSDIENGGLIEFAMGDKHK
ncbi:MAG TPA: GH92 family glycosyl hydrolase [Balneolales bacterium]|nr:GH92 family glycosyl hydrolase [Balneolales bacterium]